MLIREGKIVAIHPRSVTLRVERASACGSCRARNACEGGTPAGDIELPIDAPDAYRLGQSATLALPVSSAFGAVAIAYLLPLISLLLGVGLAADAGAPDAVVALSGLAGLGLGFTLACWLARRNSPQRPWLLDEQVATGCSRD